MKNLDEIVDAEDIANKNYVDTRTPQITVSTTAPVSPDVGEIWIDSDEPYFLGSAGLMRPIPMSDTWVAPGYINAVAHGTTAGAANRLEAWFFTGYHADLDVDNVAIECTAAVASAAAKVAVYSCLDTAWPDAKLVESGEFDLSTGGVKTLSFTHTFVASTPYWISVLHSSTATLRTVTTNALLNNLPAASAGVAAVTELRTTRTYSSGFPSTWGTVTTGQLTATAPIPHVQFQAV